MDDMEGIIVQWHLKDHMFTDTGGSNSLGIIGALYNWWAGQKWLFSKNKHKALILCSRLSEDVQVKVILHVQVHSIRCYLISMEWFTLNFKLQGGTCIIAMLN